VRLFGLTGNIGAGKSSVARLLVRHGIPVIDADQLAREVVAPGRPALAEIAARFGPKVLHADGTLDRKALAAVVFDDPAQLAEAGHPAAVYEAALIVENGLERGLAGLIVVTAPDEAQVARLLLRDGMTDAEARARMAAQLPSAEKRKKATFVIENHGSLADLEAQVAELVPRLKA
jgi:dephospho-CoA kinase